MVENIITLSGGRRVRSPFLFLPSTKPVKYNQPNEVQQKAFALKEYLRRLAAKDVGAFIVYAMKDSSGIPMKPEKFHLEWHAAADKYPRLLILAPRDHSKTESISVIRTIFELGRNPNLRIKIVTQSDEKSSTILQQIANNILDNPKIRDVFPDLIPADRGSWSKHKLMVRRKAISKDPSIEALGVLSSGTGGRADLLIFDDIVDFRNAIQQPALREIVKEAYSSVWINLLEPDGRVVYIATPWHCLSYSTLITTENGPRVISDIKVGEQVLTQKGEFRSVKKTFCRPYKGNIIHIKTYYGFGDISLTPNHKLTVRRDGRESIQTAEQVQIGDYVCMSQATFPQQVIPTFHGFEKDPDFYYFCGFWIAEGCLRNNKPTQKRVVVSTGYKDTESGITQKIVSIIRNKFKRSVWFQGRNRLDIAFSFVELGEFLVEHFGRYSYGKHLPVWLYSAPKECVIELLRGLFEGDGHFTQRGATWKLDSVSRKLIIEVAELLFHRFGLPSGASSNTAKKMIISDNKVESTPREAFHLFLSHLETLFSNKVASHTYLQSGYFENRFLWKQVKKLTTEPYEGNVYNLEVDQDHTYVLAGNFCVHNCDDQTHELLANEEYRHIVYRIEDDPLNPGHYIPIWPSKWPDEALVRRRNEIGPREFSRQFQMKAISAEEQLFTLEKLMVNYTENAVWPKQEECLFYGGLDLAAFRKNNKNDKGWNALFVIGVDKRGKHWPFLAKRLRASAPDVLKYFYSQWQRFHMEISKVENNSYQQSFIDWSKELSFESEFINHVDAHTTGSNKAHRELGLPGLAMEFDMRKWCIPLGEKGHVPSCVCDLCHWITELVDYPIGKTFDVGMSSWFAQSAVKAGSRRHSGFDLW